MRPAVALRHPDDLAAVVQIVPERPPAGGQVAGGARVMDERVALLLDERAGCGRPGIHLDHPVDLMATLVVFEREPAAVLPPLGA